MKLKRIFLMAIVMTMCCILDVAAQNMPKPFAPRRSFGSKMVEQPKKTDPKKKASDAPSPKVRPTKASKATKAQTDTLVSNVASTDTILNIAVATDSISNIAVQDSILDTSEASDSIYEMVEVEPMFPGGLDSLMNFIAYNLRYLATPEGKIIQGRVTVSFVVEKDGSVGVVKEERSPSKELSKEALRLVQSFPKWTPGKNKGKPVRVRYIIPITFKTE